MSSRTYLFKTLVRSVYNYAAPVWANYNNPSYERRQNIFGQRLLQTNNMVPGYILRRELDLQPLEINFQIQILKFWVHILNPEHNILLKNAYLTLFYQPPWQNTTGVPF